MNQRSLHSATLRERELIQLLRTLHPKASGNLKFCSIPQRTPDVEFWLRCIAVASLKLNTAGENEEKYISKGQDQKSKIMRMRSSYNRINVHTECGRHSDDYIAYEAVTREVRIAILVNSSIT
jgi:hypothetical protein